MSWEGWDLHVGFGWREGVVLNNLRFQGRPVMWRAALAEVIVPYGAPRGAALRPAPFAQPLRRPAAAACMLAPPPAAPTALSWPCRPPRFPACPRALQASRAPPLSSSARTTCATTAWACAPTRWSSAATAWATSSEPGGWPARAAAGAVGGRVAARLPGWLSLRGWELVPGWPSRCDASARRDRRPAGACTRPLHLTPPHPPGTLTRWWPPPRAAPTPSGARVRSLQPWQAAAVAAAGSCSWLQCAVCHWRCSPPAVARTSTALLAPPAICPRSVPQGGGRGHGLEAL